MNFGFRYSSLIFFEDKTFKKYLARVCFGHATVQNIYRCHQYGSILIYMLDYTDLQHDNGPISSSCVALMSSALTAGKNHW